MKRFLPFALIGMSAFFISLAIALYQTAIQLIIEGEQSE